MNQVLKLGHFFAFPMTVLFAHLIASKVLHLYRVFPNLDIPFHYIGGLSIAYTSAKIVAYLEKEKVFAALDHVVFLVFVFSLTATATVFWEFLEFIGDQIFDSNIQISLGNTMQDQFIGILGGVTWVLIWYVKFEKLKKHFLN